jgi:ABC-2 type transport system ATP-binding protein
MALTADHLVVIGAGRLLADDTVDGFVAASGRNSVRVRSPQSEQLALLLSDHGATATTPALDELEVTGTSTDVIGDVAAAHGITIHELTLLQVTLEEAFMELTHDSVEYRTEAPTTNPSNLNLLHEESVAS